MLDEFEGDEYYKQDVTAQLEGGGTVDTIVYLWQDSLRPLLYGDWDPDAFRCARWCSEHHRKNKGISSLLHSGCLLGGTRAGWWRQDQALPGSCTAHRQGGLTPDATALPLSAPPACLAGSGSWSGTWSCAASLRRTLRRTAAGRATSPRPPPLSKPRQRLRRQQRLSSRSGSLGSCDCGWGQP